VSTAIAAANVRRARDDTASVSDRVLSAPEAARRRAAVILEVLAGVRGVSDAASALGVSTTRYYGIESSALAGLVAACNPDAVEEDVAAASELQRLRLENKRLTQESLRLQALVRSAQRSLGVREPAPPPKPGEKKRGRRKPSVRALRIAGRLTGDHSPARDGRGISASDRSGG
jgi:hypothetical protein